MLRRSLMDKVKKWFFEEEDDDDVYEDV